MACKIRGIGCSNTQPFDYPELEVPKMPLIQNKHCPQCGVEMTRVGKFCGRSCSSKSARRGQLAWEQTVAKNMEAEGWKIISPTACCDRIGIKDGHVYFLEFKPHRNAALRQFQKEVRRAAPHMYRVVMGTSEGVIVAVNGDGRGARKAKHLQHRRKRAAGVTSRFIGVSWHKNKELWSARLTVKGKTMNLGYFRKEEDAGRAYDDEINKRFGNTVNFNVDPPVGPCDGNPTGILM